MKMVFGNKIGLLLLAASQATAFTSTSGVSHRFAKAESLLALSASSSSENTRRELLLMGMLLAPTLLTVGSAAPAFADVSDGNALPQGAAQFSRVVRAKADLLVSLSLWFESLR